MAANSVTELFCEYINYNFLLGILFLLALGFYVGKAFRINQSFGTAASIAVVTPFITVFNPLLFSKLSRIVDGGASYYRFIWAFPFISLSAGFLCELVFNMPGFKFISKTRTLLLQGITAALLSAVILFSGTSYLTEDTLAIPKNKFNISRATLDISQFIQDDPDHEDGDVILAPTQIMMELEAYDITLAPALPRTEYINYKKTDSGYTPLLTLILEGPESTYHHMGNVRYHVNLLDVKYIVTLTLFDLDGYMELLGYPLYNRTGDYSLYKRADSLQ